MWFVKRVVLALVAVVMVSQVADAQIFRRAIQRTRSVVQGCPNGVCPTVQTPQRSVQTLVPTSHWTYPGTIDGHLRSTHGVSAAGMSREQMLNLHDALHEGRSLSVLQTQQTGNLMLNGGVAFPQAIQRVTQPVQQVAPTQKMQLPAKAVSPAKTPSATFGLSSSSMTIPSHVLAQIAPDVSFGLETTIPEHVLAQVDTASAPVKVSESFRTSLRKAIVEARKAGKITLRDATRLRVACLSPAFLERAQELAVVQIAASGEPSDSVPLNDEGMVEVEGINWDGLAKFLEVFVPLLITLLKAFGL